ncbi:MAG: ParB/RepB/Spo0J family partition protein, partial [Terriglobia bacterium]
MSGVLEAGEAAQSREVERHMGEMAPAPVASTVLKLPLDRIYPDPDQPRRTFPEESLEELAASIREQGVLEPIQVIATDQGYQLLHGERRWRAARLAGLSWIPSIVYEQPLSDADRLTRQLIENIQREDLNDVDRAAALERLKDLLNATWDEVAEKVGITKGRI